MAFLRVKRRFINIRLKLSKAINFYKMKGNRTIFDILKLSYSLFLIMLRSFYIEIIFILMTPIILYSIISISSSKYLYSDIENLPYNDVALVLGTSKYLANGRENRYFNFRIDAAFELYKNKKVKYLLLSGDNRYKSYNEPIKMREDLLKLGVPSKDIYLDFAGFRTLDSVIRANAVFGLTNFTIVSQKFHNERAIFIARSKGYNAIAYNAQNISFLGSIFQKPRETASRMLMLFDIVINRKPYFLGRQLLVGEYNEFHESIYSNDLLEHSNK